ncbi:MOSC domain-containing protein [Crossiella cryophila]|uniref:MOSC domain-containing protein YiiM n=1 Tax=Crossiella cryophila TaxID=43355 RepID=A0A7W7C8D1_9PSEU|nr:MOSC domain-containing protein [Crossiella cryophila]MBB4676376.1 MOSC domain-containing protein YiiM [Crossiella cryophila]
MNVGAIQAVDWAGRKGKSGIDKRPVELARIERLGLAGDEISDLEHHGGEFQAVYAYAVEDLAFWSAELDRTLTPGNAGENLSLSGVDTQALVIGQRLRVGTAVLRVTAPRIPCQVFAGFWDVRGLVKRFTVAGRTGAYFAVETPGEVRPGDAVETLSTPAHGVDIATVFDFVGRNNRDRVPELLPAMTDFPPKVQGWVREHAAV